MDVRDLIKLQNNFDHEHESEFVWDEQVSQDNLDMLKFLVISLASEVGELAGITKKVLRGDFPLDSKRPAIEEECADIFIYLMKICSQMNFDLEAAFLQKLNNNRVRFAKYKKE